MPTKSAPDPAPEDGSAPVDPPAPDAPADPAPVAAEPSRLYFQSRLGFTDGALYYGTGDVFASNDSILVHWDATGGVVGGRQIYVQISEAEFNRVEADRLAAIVEPDAAPVSVPQVQPNLVDGGMASNAAL